MSKKTEGTIVSTHYTSGAELLKGEAGKIFLSLLEHTPIQVGYMVGLDRFYKTDASIRAGIYRAYQEVLKEPAKYDIPLEAAAEVETRVKSRSLQATKSQAIKKQETAELQKIDTTSLIVKGTDRSLVLLHKKLDELEKGGALKNIKITDLVKVVTALFDKGQIARGEATQNIAILSKNISKDMSSEDALEEVLNSRETIAAQKEVSNQ